MPKLSTLAWWGFWIFAFWFIITSPHAAAQAAHHIGSGLSHAAHGVSSFLAGL